MNGVIAEAAEKATSYVDDETWRRVLSNRGKSRCDGLADLARLILDGKGKLHELVGLAVDRILYALDRSRIERLFARHLAKRLPIPMVDDNLTAVARGLQVTGIIYCVINAQDLTKCACFVDIALEEGKEYIKRLLTTAATDWAQLHQIPVTS